MFLFGLATALLGAILPLLAGRVHFNLRDAGALFLVLNFGVFLCVFGLGRWIDQRGVKMPMVAGPLFVAMALALITIAPGFRELLLAALILGAGGGAMNVTTNTLVSDLYPDPREKNSALNRLGIFYGLGGLLIPAGLGALLNRFGFAPVLNLAALLSLSAGLYAATLEFPPGKHATQGQPRMPLGHRLVLILTAAMLFFQSGNEVMLAGYTTTFLVRELSMSMPAASWGLTALWVSISLMRLLLIRLALRFPGHTIVLAGSFATLLGCTLLLMARTPWAAVGALCLIGAGLAGVFPTVLGMTGTLFSGSSGTVFGLLLTVSRTGAMALPYAAGGIAEQSGIRAVIWMIMASTVLVAVIEKARRAASRKVPHM
jgi:fucose permease